MEHIKDNFIYVDTSCRANLSPREREVTFDLPLLSSLSLSFGPPC